MTMANNVTSAMVAAHDDPDVALLDIHQVALMSGLHKATIYKLVSCGKFPRPMKLGGATRWLKDELTAWFAAKCPPLAGWETRNIGPERKKRLKS